MAAALINCGAFVPLAVKWPLYTRRVSRITIKALVTSNTIQSVCLLSKGRLKERCGLKPGTKFFRLRNRQKLVPIRFGCGLDSRIYGILIDLCNMQTIFGSESLAPWGARLLDA